MKLILLALIVSGILSRGSHGAKILGIFQVPTKSHHIIGSSIMKGLAAKGHQILMISPFPEKKNITNYRDINLEGMHEIADEGRKTFTSSHDLSHFQMISILCNYSSVLSDATLRNPAVDTLIKSDEKFDLIVMEAFGNEAFFGLAYRFNAPIIVVSTTISQFVNHLSGNISPSSFVPHLVTSFTDKMTFIERTVNTAVGIGMEWFRQYKLYPVQKQLYEEFFPNAPPFEAAIRNVSFTLINSNLFFETPRPYMPNMVSMGGIHIADPKPLPKDLQKFVEEAKHGVIFFSLGSNLKSADLDSNKIEIIMKTFAKLPQRIIWKYENANLPGKPDNLWIGKWFPQSDILAHPNVKLFITHGGLLSSTEAVFRGVPVLGIPFYGDQRGNVRNFVNSGYGQKIIFADLTVEEFREKIEEVINNPKYSETIKNSAAVLQDQPMKPLEKAIYWCEYVIRHKGAQHLRSTAVDLSDIEYFIIDVIAFVLLVFSTIVIGMFLIINTLCCSSSKKIYPPEKRSKRNKPKHA